MEYYFQVKSIWISWKYQYQLVIPFISCFLTIFQLYRVRCTWWDIHLFEGDSLDMFFNYLFFNFRNLSGQKDNIFHVLLSNIEETCPFPQYLVVNSCNLDGIEYMCAPLMIYEWVNCNWCILWVSCSVTDNLCPLGRISYHLEQTTSCFPKGPKLVYISDWRTW